MDQDKNERYRPDSICHYLLCYLAKFIALNNASHFEGFIYQLVANKYIFIQLFTHVFTHLFSQKMFLGPFKFQVPKKKNSRFCSIKVSYIIKQKIKKKENNN